VPLVPTRPHMTQERLLELLREFLPTHSPGGDEGEMDRALLPYFERTCREVRQDAAENLIGLLKGTGERPPIIVIAHKDELGMIVKRVEPDGRLRLQPLGGIPPWKYGEGLVDILAPGGPIQGVMGVGSLHTTAETSQVQEAREKPLDWTMVSVFSCYSAAELAERGVYAGTRVCLSRERKGPTVLGSCVCGYAIDDKGALALMVEAMKDLAQGPPPPQDIYFVASSVEELMGGGATVAASRLPAETMLALEIAPIAEEYGLVLDSRPVVWYKDRITTYTKSFCDELASLGERLGTGIQRAVYSHAATDASGSRHAGHVGRVSVLGFPTLNSHGYEVSPIQGILNMHRLLVSYLKGERA
jgi:putative aminopeptidase FrvX